MVLEVDMVDSTASYTFSSVDALLAIRPKGQTSGEKEKMSILLRYTLDEHSYILRSP